MNQAPEPLDAETDEDPRLITAAQEYLAALEAGRRPDRAEFIGRHSDLAEQLEPYLDAIDMVHGAGPALSRPPAKPAVEPPPPIEPLGDFSIVREIGRGGMGVVYEAVQLSLGRRVALKVLPFAAALDARQLQRFKNEAQAAAQLHHTNIVPVYAVGCDRATHYYAMQLIEGQNLADLIHQLRAVERVEGRSGPSRSGGTQSKRSFSAAPPSIPGCRRPALIWRGRRIRRRRPLFKGRRRSCPRSTSAGRPSSTARPRSWRLRRPMPWNTPTSSM